MWNAEELDRIYLDNKELVDAAVEANNVTTELIKRNPEKWARDLVASVFEHIRDD